MKKLFALLFALLVSLGLVACGNDPKDETKEPTKEETTDVETEAPTKNPTVEPSKEPTKEETKEPTKEPTKEETKEPTKEPTVEPTEEPSTPEVNPGDVTSIKDVLAANVGDAFTIKGVITATNAKENKPNSFVISDASGSMFCYEKAHSFELGDEVTLKVVRGENRGYPQLTSPELVGEVVKGKDFKVNEEIITLTAQELSDMIAAGEDLNAKFASKWVKISGILTSGQYTNLGVTADAAVANLYYNQSLKESAGKEATVLGFVRGISEKNISLQLQSVEFGAVTPDPDPEPQPQPGDVTSIKDALLLPEKEVVTIQGLVIAANANAYILTDGTDEIYVFAGAKGFDNTVYAVGDEVKLTGERANFFGTLQVKPQSSEKVTATHKDEVQVKPADAKFLNEFITHTEGFDIVKVTVKGTYKVSDKYCNILVDGTDKLGLNGLTDEVKAKLASLDGKAIEATVYLTGYNSRDHVINTLYVSHASETTPDPEPQPQPGDVTSIKDVLAANVGDAFTIKGVVSATNSKGGKKDSFVITDASGSMFCYEKAYAFEVGDEVTLNVVRGENKGYPQLTQPKLVGEIVKVDVIEINEEPIVVTAQELADMIAAGEDLNAKFASKWVMISGVLTTGQFTNLGVTADAHVANLYSNVSLKESAGKEATVLGFVRGISEKNITIQVSEFKVETAPLPDVNEVITVKEALALPYETPFKTKGIVTYVGLDSYVINDGTASLYVYVGEKVEPEFEHTLQALGAEVEIEGIIVDYFGTLEAKVKVSKVLTENNQDQTVAAPADANYLAQYVQAKPFQTTKVSLYGQIVVETSDKGEMYYNMLVGDKKLGFKSLTPEVEASLTALNGKYANVTVYLFGYHNKAHIINVLYVNSAEAEAPKVSTIKEALDAPFNTDVTTQGVIVANGKGALVISDGTDSLYVYTKGNFLNLAIGDEIKVSGTKKDYFLTVELDARSIEKVSEGHTDTNVATTPTAEFLQTYSAETTPHATVKVSVTGTVQKIEKNNKKGEVYYEYELNDTTNTFRLKELTPELEATMETLIGTEITVEAYLFGFHNRDLVFNLLYVSHK